MTIPRFAGEPYHSDVADLLLGRHLLGKDAWLAIKQQEIAEIHANPNHPPHRVDWMLERLEQQKKAIRNAPLEAWVDKLGRVEMWLREYDLTAIDRIRNHTITWDEVERIALKYDSNHI